MISSSTILARAIIAAASCAISACGTLSMAHPDPAPWVALFDGVSHRTLPAPGPVPMAIQVLQIDLTAPGVSLIVTPGDSSDGHEYRALKTSEALMAQDWQAAVNGGYFLPFAGGSPGGDDYIPQPGQGTDVSGAAIHDGRVVSPIETDLDRRVNAILCIWREAEVVIRDGQECGPGVREAMAAGPRLLRDGQRLSYESFDAAYGAARHPRTAVGLDARRRLAWLVTVDGRQPGFSEGASLDELTDILVALGASDAINLDGGGSTTMVVESANGPVVLNRPIHTAVPGRERPSANHLGVRARPRSDAIQP
ncbi:phosphodiester glycosidase family protein [Brevundimonas sp.]|uniref:phosphodiester glycosidase family protein n=1 Tax=Brevundimonas sp. TaxID=1871086 RepID=UPI0026073B86|nr:phosphodiester glycosidase family protein [Brevundimonas sp.]